MHVHVPIQHVQWRYSVAENQWGYYDIREGGYLIIKEEW